MNTLRKIINKRTFSLSIRKLSFKILLGFVLVVAISLILFIIQGYFSEFKPVSYLPEMNTINLDQYQSGVNQTKLESPWYILLVDEDGGVTIKTLEGEVIISNLTYYAVCEGTNNNWGLDNVSVKLNCDSIISIQGEGPLAVLVNILLTVHKDLPKIDVDIKTRYNINTIVRREALVAEFDVPVSEVYRKNRQIDIKSFDSEYWLEREGVRFGRGSRSALIYHTPFVSSLQLDSEKNLLFINLEYFLDHPYTDIPYQVDGGGRWRDLSTANYSAGRERINNFSIYFGNFPKVTPRLMLVPDGYLAGYIFTEHADGANIRTHRAVYFGSEEISNFKDAVGGFAGHKIPTTKSVFYANPEGLSLISIRDDADYPQYLDFLDQLYKTGLYDICLHTPDNFTSNRKLLEESIKYMKDRFNTKTWIDHGMYSGKINRECFVCDGLNPNSEFYAADLWEKFNTLYFWSPAVEFISEYSPNYVSIKKEIAKLNFRKASIELWGRYLSQRELKENTFYTAFIKLLRRSSSKSELNSLKPIKGDSYPTPLYWQNLTRTNHFYSWVTDYAKGYSKLSSNKAKKQVIIEQRLLDKLLADWGLFINHGYFPRIRPGFDDGVWTVHEGKVIINPYFDRILEIMARLRDEGNLFITTVRDMLDYWILIENVSFKYMSDGIIYIYNGNDKPIKGLSLVVNASNVWINNKIPKFRRVGENTIFWFDIPARNQVSLIVEP